MLEISNREDLFNLMEKNKSDKPKTVSQKTCPNCQQKIYRVFVKGVETWFGCACSKGRAINKFLPK